MKNQKGFTLIEIIAVLVLVAILAAASGMGIVQGTRGYLFAMENVEMAQKANQTLARLTLEIENITNVTTADTNSMDYTMRTGPASGNITRSLGLDGTDLRINVSGNDHRNGSLLLDNVNAFELKYYQIAPDGTLTDNWTVGNVINLYAIGVKLTLNRVDSPGNTLEFTTMVNPRRNQRYNGPINWNR